jgi:glycerate kinase
VPTRFLVAPDSFKGTFDAFEVADALARGIEAAGSEADRCPVGDGGEGTAAVLVAHGGGEWREESVPGPLGDPVEARFGLIDGGKVAVIDAAAASGLTLVEPEQRDAEAASTRGTGELIAASLDAGATAVLLGAGGSGTTDGGQGAIEALRERGGIDGASLSVLCDVKIAFEQAAPLFAPQKGAGRDAVKRLAHRLDELAAGLPRDPRGVPMTGAAGGLAGGLWAEFGAELLHGAEFVLDRIGFDARLEAAGAVIAGEGRFDVQSLEGKVVGEIAGRAAAAGHPLHLVAGQVRVDHVLKGRLGAASIAVATTLEEMTKAAERIATRSG